MADSDETTSDEGSRCNFKLRNVPRYLREASSWHLPFRTKPKREMTCREWDDGIQKERELSKLKSVDIRYLCNMRKRFKDKISGTYACSPQICPMIKERLENHQQLHHSTKPHVKHPRNAHRNCTNGENSRQSITSSKSKGNINETCSLCLKRNVPLSPIISKTPNKKMKKKESLHICLSDCQGNSQNFGPFKSIRTPTDSIDKPLKSTETRDLLILKKELYRTQIQEEVYSWIEEIPLYINMDPTAQTLKSKTLDLLINRIYYLHDEVNDDRYETRVKYEINNCLNSLPLYANVGKFTSRESLIDKLWNRIKDLNYKVFNVQNNVYFSNCISDTKINKIAIDTKNEIKCKVFDWIMHIKLKHDGFGKFNERKLAADIYENVIDTLNNTTDIEDRKTSLKAKIVDMLNDLPLKVTYPKNSKLEAYNLAEDLTNRILNVLVRNNAFQINKYPRNQQKNSSQCTESKIGNKLNLKNDLREEVADCLENTVVNRTDIQNEITDILIESLESIRSGNEKDVKNEICNLLQRSGQLPEPQANDIANLVVRSVRDIIVQDIFDKEMLMGTRSLDKACLSATLSVFTSESENPGFSYCPITSTPKNPKEKIDLQRFNTDEITYMENVADIIKVWMRTLPEQFDASEDKHFKETIVNDLAGDITDQAKWEQWTSENLQDRDKFLTYFVYRWLCKYDIFENVDDAKPQINDIVCKIKEIPIPILIKPYKDGRPAQSPVIKTSNILEDEISVWVREQPLSIYSVQDETIKDEKIHQLAELLQKHISNKNMESINGAIVQWLNTVVKPEERKSITKLSETLKEKILRVPQDGILAERCQKKLNTNAENISCSICAKSSALNNIKDENESQRDKTLQEFVSKFIQHNYDVDDPLARGAFLHLLKSEFKTLSSPIKKEVYNNCAKSLPHENFPKERLDKELQYIKDISDWLKNIPIKASYNMPGNKERVEFINNLAKHICDVEEERKKSPEAMNYNMYLASVISQLVIQLPILSEFEDNIMVMIDQLVDKIIASRSPPLCCTNAISDKTIPSENSSSIQEQNISDFIEEYINLNGREIIDDELKLEAWSARLFKEIKKMLQDDPDPKKLNKAELYSRFADISIPGDEMVKNFELEMEYVKEISEWIKNLPFLPSNLSQENEKINMISDLAKNILYNYQKVVSTRNQKTVTDFDEYLKKWITTLPLDKRQNIDLNFALRQLKNRINKVNKVEAPTENNVESLEATNTWFKGFPSIKFTSCSNTTCSGQTESESPRERLVEAIEKWCENLPIRAENDERTKSMKNNIAKTLYQKIGELAVDPMFYNDDVLYQNAIADEIDTQLENVPQNPELQSNIEMLKSKLLEEIMQARFQIKKISAGTDYKRKLENTLNASLPNPIPTRSNNEAFQMYRDRIADMFILENFDHTPEEVKLKYENRIKKEIDQYFDGARNKNALPISKDEMYNELYSALYKVPFPNETAIAKEVEEVKTRCEIDAWFEELPLREADGLKERLEWNKILTMLAKRLHEMEKETDSDFKIHKEITKWLVKLPLLPEYEKNIENFANDLANRLNSTIENRKCIPREVTVSKSNGLLNKLSSSLGFSQKKGILGTSQVAGPSSKGKMWISPQSKMEQEKMCCQSSTDPQKKSTDLILEAVETWCDQLPIMANTSQDNIKIIKENLTTKIIIKISELNADPRIFNDDLIYDDLLDEELDTLLIDLPTCCELKHSKSVRKNQLKEEIRRIKPLIREERTRHEYKQELRNTVANILEEPLDKSADNLATFNNLKDELIDYYVELNYNKDDDDGKLFYKKRIHDVVVQYLIKLRDQDSDKSVDPLVKRNQLLCELAKISVPSDKSLKEEVEEIRMKNEVAEFFNRSLKNESKDQITAHIKPVLAKRLNEIEKSGHNCSNDKKMKSEISRCLKKIDVEIDSNIIDDFIKSLRENESIRKAPPPRKSVNCYVKNQSQVNRNSERSGTWKKLPPGTHVIDQHNLNGLQTFSGPTSHSSRSQECLQPAAEYNSRYYKPIPFRENRLSINEDSNPSVCDLIVNQLGSPGLYDRFGEGVALSSSQQRGPPNSRKLSIQRTLEKDQKSQTSQLPVSATSDNMTVRRDASVRFQEQLLSPSDLVKSRNIPDDLVECNCSRHKGKRGKPYCDIPMPECCDFMPILYRMPYFPGFYLR